MKQQEKVADFLEKHELDAAPGFRILDLAAEIGEIAGDAAKSSEYGLNPEKLDVKKDEIGDAFFSLLAVAESLGVDAGEALEESLSKYRSRIDEKGEPGSR